MGRNWSNQESTNKGIAFRLLFKTSQDFEDKLVFRNTYLQKDIEYIFKILNLALHDKIFRATSQSKALFLMSSKVEVMLKMNEVFNKYEGTQISKHNANSAHATYTEDSEDLDIDDLDIELPEERIGNRESGFKTSDNSVRFTINEIINREKRYYDYLVKEIFPLFSSRTYAYRKENYE